MNLENYVAPKVVAKRHGVCDRTVRYAIQRGDLNAHRFGRVWLIPIAAAFLWKPKRGRGKGGRGKGKGAGTKRHKG